MAEPTKPCPECNSPMEQKFWLPLGVDEEGQGGYNVWQCPNCKNIEIEQC